MTLNPGTDEESEDVSPFILPSRARSLQKLNAVFRKFFDFLQSSTLPQ